MKYYLAPHCVLKRLENPSLYDTREDELYELDADAFEFLMRCSTTEGSEVEDREFAEYCIAEGLITREMISVRRPVATQSPVPSLRYLELQITDKCNLRCGHCYLGLSGKRELALHDIRSALDQFEEMQGLRLLITGGEPLMHSGFSELNSMLPYYGFRKVLITNGLLLDKNILKGLNIDEIQFSVDGMEKGHDALRGTGSYGKLTAKVKDALSEGIAVSVATVVHRENLDEFSEMEDFFRGLGIKEWTVDVPCSVGNMKGNAHLHVPPEIAGKYLNYGFGGGMHGGEEGYACGVHLAAVTADGTVCKCAFYSHAPVGSIKEGLRKGWEKIRPVRMAELECFSAGCRFMEECRGGCRYRAELEGGALKTDLYKCHCYDIINSTGMKPG